MCSRVEYRRSSLLAALLALRFMGCADSRPCEPERCDGRDNDCDRRIDEDFLNSQGLYADDEHCGACGLACDEVFPTAAETRCLVRAGRAECQLVRCPEGEDRAGAGACAAATPVSCLPCVDDAECAVRSDGARCVEDAMGGGRCAQACGSGRACPEGFRCRQLREFGVPVCLPVSGSCQCDAAMEGAEFGCVLRPPEAEAERGPACAGVQRCAGETLTACEAALEESCNEADDDCDGRVDEGFTDARGGYTMLAHCGGCGAVCAAPGPHMQAGCEMGLDAPECRTECLEGFVDLDGLAANGCECEIFDGTQPRISVDADCDGQNDPAPELVFVSQAGDDALDGQTPDTPLRSLSRGLALGAQLGRDVLIARGVYEGPIGVPSGIAVTGGYSPDFQEHDPTLYPVWIEAPAGLDGAPVLRCNDVRERTRIEDITLEASAASSPGQGSTAVLLDGCGPEVVIERVTILAARGAPADAGEDSSARLAEFGRSLAELSGASGGVGAPGGDDAIGCPIVKGGTGGAKQCSIGDVSGGRGGNARCSVLDCENGSGTPCGNAGCTDFTSGGACDIAAARAIATPNPVPEAGRGSGAGGAGIATYDAPTNHGACSFCDDNPSLPRLGDDGEPGRAGKNGVAGGACGDAVAIDAEGRVVGSGGSLGSDGWDGSGGGGGSAGAGFSKIRNTRGNCESIPGGAGGGGGSGGCGAPGAAGGGGGGGSVGVVVRLGPLLAQGPVLRDVRIVTASGGDGGDGGNGAAGGNGGSGGIGGASEFWCARNGGRGGDGGSGGAGAGGGGGCGGPSLGVIVAADGGELDGAYVDAVRESVQIELTGASGRGGRAGFSPGEPGHAGIDGARSGVLVLGDVP